MEVLFASFPTFTCAERGKVSYSSLQYCPVSPHEAAQLAVLPGIWECLHTRLLSWKYCWVSRGALHQAHQWAALCSTHSAPFCLPTSWVLCVIRKYCPHFIWQHITWSKCSPVSLTVTTVSPRQLWVFNYWLQLFRIFKHIGLLCLGLPILCYGFSFL